MVLPSYTRQAIDDRTMRLIGQWFAAGGVESDVTESPAEQGLRTTVAGTCGWWSRCGGGLESSGYLPAPLVIDPAGRVSSEPSVRALHEWRAEAMA